MTQCIQVTITKPDKLNSNLRCHTGKRKKWLLQLYSYSICPVWYLHTHVHILTKNKWIEKIKHWHGLLITTQLIIYFILLIFYPQVKYNLLLLVDKFNFFYFFFISHTNDSSPSPASWFPHLIPFHPPSTLSESIRKSLKLKVRPPASSLSKESHHKKWTPKRQLMHQG